MADQEGTQVSAGVFLPVLLATVKVVPEPRPAAPEKRAEVRTKDGAERVPSPAARTAAKDAADAKCYDDLLSFSLGDSDEKANERIKKQKCE